MFKAKFVVHNTMWMTFFVLVGTLNFNKPVPTTVTFYDPVWCGSKVRLFGIHTKSAQSAGEFCVIIFNLPKILFSCILFVLYSPLMQGC